MRFTDLVTLSARSYITRPLRTFLTVLGVSVGIGTILFLVSLGYGMQKTILDRITTSDSLLSLEVSPGPSDVIRLTPEKVESIKKMPEISEISPLVSYSGQINHGSQRGDGMIYGVEDSYFRLSGIVPKQGKTFDDSQGTGAVITTAGLKLLDIKNNEAIGKEISLLLFAPQMNEEGIDEIKIFEPDIKYTITGIIENNDNNYIFVPLNTLKGVNIIEYNKLQVKVSDSQKMEIVRENIINQGFLVSALSDVIEQANKIFGIIQLILALFGLIALIVSAIGMFNTMTIALLERINEIGIMRAIGASGSDIMGIFLIESTIMGFLGGVGGVAIGFLGGKLANLGLNFLARSFGGQTVNLFYSPIWFVIFIIAFSTIVGFLTGVYPSHRASKLNPLDALRYK